MKILFLIKGNSGYGYGGPKSGLIESAKLTANNISLFIPEAKTKVKICVDGNDIDREVYNYQPDICLIEALWVTPDKLKEITQLHTKVLFVVRVHSEIPFLAGEGVAIQWLKEYVYIKNVLISFNSETTNSDYSNTVSNAVYLPNIYSHIDVSDISLLSDFFKRHRIPNNVHIGCFGAIRPMKNQLLQAFAAVQFGLQTGKKVFFHINGSRTEEGGESIIKNIRSLFRFSRHVLVEHNWLSRKDFLDVVCQMDLGLQLSFSESFNIVSADFVSQGVPVIVSEAVRWMPNNLKVDNDINELIKKMKQAIKLRYYYDSLSQKSLNNYNVKAISVWAAFLQKHNG